MLGPREQLQRGSDSCVFAYPRWKHTGCLVSLAAGELKGTGRNVASGFLVTWRKAGGSFFLASAVTVRAEGSPRATASLFVEAVLGSSRPGQAAGLVLLAEQIPPSPRSAGPGTSASLQQGRNAAVGCLPLLSVRQFTATDWPDFCARKVQKRWPCFYGVFL